MQRRTKYSSLNTEQKIKDDLFQGNEDAYYLTENAFAFAASAMIPIGQASTAGNLTFKSTATIVAKEGISMGAGAGAQKITTDVTGNDTAGMSVDEHSNTLKTLDEVFEGNRLDYDNTAFKIRSGVDGVSKSVGNADIVYGKITYILDDVDGDILGIYDAKTGLLTQQFVYDSDLGWLLK